MMMRLFLAALLLFLLTSQAAASSKGRDVKEGNALYIEGDYAGSIEKYNQALEKDPESDIINFDIGTAYYKKGKYGDAISNLQKSLLSEDDELKEKTHYNMGNAYYQSGITREEEDIDTAIAALELSLSHFENALKMDDKDTDAEYNYDFVRQELVRLQEKRKQQEQQRQKNQEGQEGQKTGEEQQAQEGQQGEEGQEQQQAQEGQEEQEGQQAQEGEEEQEGEEGQGAEQAQEGEEDQPQGQAMSKKEAQMLLDNYQQNEEPQGLLNFIKHKGRETPVLKDW